MPVRIYDIAKKFGIESKVVLAKAKELGIAARVASSSLDKITAEFLEGHFTPAPPVAPPEHAPSPAPAEPILVVSPPPPLSPPAEEVPAVSGETLARAPVEVPDGPVEAPPAIELPVTEAPMVEAKAPVVEPPQPQAPRPPRVGDKVGFIQLPTKP